jgi:hypothetical protein
MNIYNNCYPSSRSYQEISRLVAETGLLHISLFHLHKHPLSRRHKYFKVLNLSLLTNTLVYRIILTCSYTHCFWYSQISVSFTAITCNRQVNLQDFLLFNYKKHIYSMSVQKVNQFIKSLSRHLAVARVQECAGQFLSYALFCLTSVLFCTEIFVFMVNCNLILLIKMHQKKCLAKDSTLIFFHTIMFIMMLLSRLYNLAGFIQNKVYIKGTNLHRASLIVHLHSCV